MQYITNYMSALCPFLGQLLLSSDGKNITGLWMQEQKYYAATIDNIEAGAELDKDSGTPQENSDLSVFLKAKNWLDRYFNGQKPQISELPLAPTGGAFRQQVWQILTDIPYGQYITYGDIAKTIAKKQGKPKISAQAVGGAVGHNPISIIIPCHRVVGAGGNLTGYAGGIDKKIQLLQHEGVKMSDLFVPKRGTAL